MQIINPIALGLEVARMSGYEAHCVCPFHDDHSPSASFNVKKGKLYCFQCQQSWTTVQVAEKLGTSMVFTTLEELDIPMITTEQPDWSWVHSLPKAYGNSYLASRGVRDALVAAYDIRESNDGVVFPLWDRNGTIIGAQERLYRGAYKYIFYGERPPIWPMHRLGESPYVVIVEGIFGVLRARKYGVHAFAIMGAGILRHAIPYFAGFTKKIGVFDDDPAGHKATKVLLESGIGAQAFAPGAEADEEDDKFWSNIFRSPNLVSNCVQFSQISV